MLKFKPNEFLSSINKHQKRKLLGLGVLLLIFAIGIAAWNANIKDDRKIYAQAAGHKIYEDEIRELIGNNAEISEHDAAQVLADKYLVEALTNEQGVNITEQDKKSYFGDGIEQSKETNKYTYQSQMNGLYFDKLQAHNNGIYKGKLLITNFSRNVKFIPTLPEDEENNPDLGNPEAIAKDKKYAEDLINRLYNDVKSGKITFDEAIEIERKDPIVGTKAYSTLPHSGSFNTTFSTNPILNVESIKEKVRSIKPGEISEPFVVRVGNSLDGKSTAESYFLVIQMDESSGGAGGDFNLYIEEAKKRLKYEIYV